MAETYAEFRARADKLSAQAKAQSETKVMSSGYWLRVYRAHTAACRAHDEADGMAETDEQRKYHQDKAEEHDIAAGDAQDQL